MEQRKAFRRYKQDGDSKIKTEDIDLAFSEIIPVYESSKEKILALENYAKDRARFASQSEKPAVGNVTILEYDDITNFR